MSKRQSPISIKPSPKTPAMLCHIRVWPMPIPNCLFLVALPANTTRREMQPPARRWSWIRRWPTPTPSWAPLRWGTSGTLLEERLSTRKLSSDRRESDFASAMEQGFRSGGWKGALTKGIEARQTQRKTGYASAYQIAILYADLGDKNKAFRWLNTAYQERDTYLYGSRTDFLLDPLRSDPRFAELVRKVGLPQ